MHKHLLILALALTSIMTAQTSIQLSIDSTSSVFAANSILTTTTTPTLKNTITVDIKNISAVSHTYDVKRYDEVLHIAMPGDTAIPNFCFATLCTGKEVTISIVPLVLGAGESASDDTTAAYNMLDADLIEAGTKGFSSVKYTFFESNNPSDSVQFTVHYNKELMFVGLKDYSSSISNFNLFPNPSNGNVNLSLSAVQEGKAEIVIFNSMGQSVFQKSIAVLSGNNTVDLALNELNSGVYLVQIHEGESTICKKLIIE